MLVHLSIQNLAIIEQLSIDFDEGLTVLTGETGAGKSIIIDGLNLALGERVDNSLIRQGQKRCEVSAIFDVATNVAAQQWLVNQQLGEDDVNECILRRQLNLNGSSRCFINDTPVNQRLVQELAAKLVTIHSQHAHYQLNTPTMTQTIVDEFAHHGELFATGESITSTVSTIGIAKNKTNQ